MWSWLRHRIEAESSEPLICKFWARSPAMSVSGCDLGRLSVTASPGRLPRRSLSALLSTLGVSWQVRSRYPAAHTDHRKSLSASGA
jgi:hypothetical protein